MHITSVHANSRGTSGPFQGVGAYALNRAQALAGNPAAQVLSFLAPPTPDESTGDGLLPADLDGITPPPPGSPNYFVGTQDTNGPYTSPSDAINLWKFTANFAVPASSSFVLTNTIPVGAFNSMLGICSGTSLYPAIGNCKPDRPSWVQTASAVSSCVS
ncbi:MAG: hypothetical protein IPK98_16635 [Chloracidobacterium sp.]|nr:hypothetical protein [Chloracidobacterium sp.]